jgi:rhamnogalacturonyl hydrolase YesR
MGLVNLNELSLKICLSSDLSTYDPYDIWKTAVGSKVKALYNRNKSLALLPAGLLTILDLYLNNRTRYFYKKQEFPVVRAIAANTLLNIYQKSGNTECLDAAKEHLSWLIENPSRGYSGFCWGANMKWVSNNALYDINTPFITNTPYALEAFVSFQRITNSNDYNDIITSIFDFIDKDLYKHIDTAEMLCLSYSPLREARPVTNANSYALYALSILSTFVPEKAEKIRQDILRLFNFICAHQNKDGSWWYYADQSAHNFIDCFHSCFILKNLLKASKLCPMPSNFERVISEGYSFLKNNLFDRQYSLFKRFATVTKINVIRFDLYDNAEMLNLAHLLGDQALYDLLNDTIKKNFITKNTIYSAIDFLNIKRNQNMLRWAVMPYLFAASHAAQTQLPNEI